jgi:AraC family transcriptional regulator, activator of mtrCDE
VLLDRLLETAELDVLPLAVCDVRRGVRVELPIADDATLLCIVRGSGELRTMTGTAPALRGGASGDAPGIAIGMACVAVVPPGTPCVLEPEGGSRRALTVEAAGKSDHVAKLIAGAGEPALLVVCARLRAVMRGGLDLFEAMRAPLVVDLSDVAVVLPMFECLLEEQQLRLPGNRRMSELLLQQCLTHALRKLCGSADGALPWLDALRDPGLSRALNAILRTPASAHSLRSLAEVAGMTRAVFGARFTRAFGRAPLELLDQVRMREALRLLRTTNLSVASIATRVGISTRSALARELAAASAHAPRWLGTAQQVSRVTDAAARARTRTITSVGAKSPRGSA